LRATPVGKVDEAQRLTSECIEFLRYLHDHPRTRFALMLMGGDDAWTVLSREPMLRSRIFRRVNVTPLTGAQV
jgi:DNA transposition AAA+ family ATPase